MLFSFIVDQQTVAAQADKVTFVTYRNPIFGIEVEYPSDWGRLDLSFLQNNSADLNFYPLDDASGAEQDREFTIITKNDFRRVQRHKN